MPPLIVSVNLLTGASGIVENVVTNCSLPFTEVFARRSRAIWPRSGISRLGSVRIRMPWLNRIPCTRYTGPLSGFDSSGVTAVACPISVDAGQFAGPVVTASARS